MQDPQTLIERFKSRVHVLDGGLATELEKRGHDISGKLWSARVLLEDPDAIEQLHYDYLKAGADIIITSSYQLTFQGMQEAGYTHEQAEDALWKSVEVAVKARDRYLNELDEDPPEDRQPLIAASIGPFGAYEADGGEYRGDYILSPGELEWFHLPRFEALIRSEADFIAFETIPTWREVVAIGKMLLDNPIIPGWLTMSCKDGERNCNGNPVGDLYKVWQDQANLIGLGANCTSPRHITSLTTATRSVTEKPVVVYPNSGEGWDAEQRCWIGENDADHFAEHAREWIKAGANIIGGCCRTGPEHIAELRKLVDSL